MIYAQRPDATACAEYDFWNQRMRRYIRRGSRGIALIDNGRGRPVLRYVFDVSDTGRMDNGLNPNLWQYREEHRDAVTAALEERFDVSGESGFTGQLEKIAAQLANEYWNDHREDILHIIDGSFLEGYDELNTGAAFRSAATVSITYMLMSRCGLEPDNYFQHEDFLSIFDFNTQDTVTELGTAVSIGSEQVLRQIERTVKQYERTKSAERSMEHEERADLHTGGGLPVSQRGVAGTAGPGPGEVREDAPAVLEGAPSGPVQPAGLEGDPVHSSAGDRGHSQQPSGEHDAPAGEGGGGHGTVEGQQPDGVGGPDEQLQGPGGGNYFVGAGLQLSFMPPEIPSQREQMEAILEAESADAPSAFSIPQADVDRVLRGHGGKLRIFELYQQNLPARSIVAAIRKEYGATGGGVVLSDGSYIFLDYRPKTGIEFWRTSTDPKFIVKWTDVEKRIRQMVNEGSYLSKAEMENYLSDYLVQPPKEELPAPAPSQEAPAPAGPAPMPASMSFREDYEAVKKAHPGDIVLYQLGDFYEMFGPDARVASHELNLMLTQRNFPDVGRVAMCGIPSHKLDEYVQKLRDRHDVTASSIGPDGKRHTVSYLSVEHEARNAREAEVPTPAESAPIHVPGASPPIPAPAPAREIAQEDIDAALQAWNGDTASKRRVQQYMTAHAREKDTAAWLRTEYGGELPMFPVQLPGTEQYQHLPWPKVQRRIAQLVKEDRFFTETELANFDDIDTSAVREQLEQEPTPTPTVRKIYEQYKPILKEFVLTDGPYQNACQNSDRENAVIEGHAAVTRAAQDIRDPDFMRLYFDMSGFRNRLHREIIDETYPVLSQTQREQAEVPDLSGQPVTHEGDAVPEFVGAANLPPRDPLAPPYKVGDTVYLNNTAFEITDAYKILEDSLNLRDVRIYDTIEDPDGKERRVLNAKETTLAAQKQQALREAFQDWIWKDPRRRQTLVKQYNEEMNCIRPREYDGSHIVFSGINPEIKLQPHQVNAIAHVLYGGNTLLAHEVGAGKTFEMIAAAMESKRLGLCHKSIFVVPNHLTEQTASEFLRLYPSANILVTTKKDFEARKRKKFCARIATGDYDAVIIGHSQFEKIPISPERQERLLQEQIWEITSGIQELEGGGAERFTVKQLERTKRQLEARLEKLQANHRKDDVVTFEQLGVDMMFVDESDNYKNLFLYTKMRNVAGLATTDAQKSSDMFAKCRYLDEITKNRGTVFATGTPISNSMTEMYTIQRYLQYDRLQEMGMGHFDCWASRFGETVTALELAPEGTGYRARTRFAKFFNLPELMNMFKEVADIKTADQLHLPTPKVEYHTIASKPTLIQQAMVKELSERASEVHAGSVDPRTDNMLKITSDGRKLGLDQRVIDPTLPDEPGTKVNACVENILQQWRDGDDKKLTQLVFCDISTPKAAPSKRAAKGAGDKLDNPLLHMLENSIPLEPEKPFTVYEDIRQKLIAGGMPPDQVAFIHEAKTDVQKKELFSKVRSGQVRVLIGSTFKMGAGTNVQDKLIALHDLDCPWRPRDLTQRKGRIERRGNDNEQVHVYRYGTEATFDVYLWQTVENKQKFISQIMTSKSPVRSCEDVDEAALSYAEIKALCAGDPRIKERMELDVDVSKLKIMKSAHQSKQFQMEDNLLKYFPEQIAQHQGFIKGLEADMKTVADHPHPMVVKEKPAQAQVEQTRGETADAPGADAAEPAAQPEAPAVPGTTEKPAATSAELVQGFAGMVVQGETFSSKEEAGKALLSAYMAGDIAELIEIGSYRGFTMFSEVRNFQRELVLKGEMTHRTTLGIDPTGALIRIDHTLDKIPERLAAVKSQLDDLFAQREAAKAEIGKPFPREDELKEKSARLAELDVLLNIDGSHSQGEQAIAKSARPSVLDSLKRPRPATPDKPDKDKPKRPQQER